MPNDPKEQNDTLSESVASIVPRREQLDGGVLGASPHSTGAAGNGVFKPQAKPVSERPKSLCVAIGKERHMLVDEVARRSGQTMSNMINQMIDYCLSHMADPDDSQ